MFLCFLQATRCFVRQGISLSSTQPPQSHGFLSVEEKDKGLSSDEVFIPTIKPMPGEATGDREGNKRQLLGHDTCVRRRQGSPMHACLLTPLTRSTPVSPANNLSGRTMTLWTRKIQFFSPATSTGSSSTVQVLNSWYLGFRTKFKHHVLETSHIIFLSKGRMHLSNTVPFYL